MLRGRHRGLPDALDRAVLLPREFKQSTSQAAAHKPLAEDPQPAMENLARLPESQSERSSASATSEIVGGAMGGLSEKISNEKAINEKDG